MSEQIHSAVDLGVVPPLLPEIEFLREFAETLTTPPPQVIYGISSVSTPRTGSRTNIPKKIFH